MHQSNQPVSKIEEQFKIIADSAPVLIWITGIDKLCYFFNAGWLRFTGRTMEQELGNGWTESVHPDDLERCLDIYVTSFNARKEFKMEYRLKRHDGVYRWLIDNGVPRYTHDGEFAGYIGSCMDIDDTLESERVKKEFIITQALNKEIALNEELASANEEMTSTNEELIAINNELHKAQASLLNLNNELEQKVAARTKALEDSEAELQVINRELSTTNEELAAANEEMTSTNEELLQTQKELQVLLSEQAIANKEIQHNEKRFRFMLNAIPQQVWTATPNGALDYVNQVVCDNFGYNTQEIVGHGWQKFIHPDDLPDCLTKWVHSLETATEYVVEFRLLFDDGLYYWHLARAVPYTEDNQIRLWLGTNTNIELQKNNELKKDEFLSIASHELKTPLTSIKAFNQLMKRAKDTVQVVNFVDKSAEHIIRLEKLINDLLDVTKINAGKMSYAMDPFSFGQMLRESVESIQHTAPHKIILESVADITYTGDYFRLEQVMNNFISNAVKYSPGADQILVNSKVEQGNIVVSVKDFGIGIARENLDRLFDRYYRVDNTAMRFEGLGLGLFISSELLKRHNGSFWIESEQGKGSTFFFRLPITTDNELVPVKKTDTFYQDEHITIIYHQDLGRMYVDWTGFQDMASVQKGCMLMLDYLVKNNCDRIVNDNTRVQGNWSDAVDWVGNVWFPMMERAGLKYFAHLFSPSTFSQLAARKSIDIMAGIITTQYFTDIQLAEQWVDNAP